ncbi:MAG: NrsF family protein [Myxococcota bacterium]|nr:NrsF family protein [Myxococcota bacterium]
MAQRDDLIDGLVSELEPAGPLRRPGPLTALWWAGSWIFVLGVTLAVAPMRPGALDQLLSAPRFAFETLFGAAAGLVAVWMAFALGIPGHGATRRRVAAGLGLLVLWSCAYVVGLFDPALEPSMLGKRPGCVFEVLIYGTPTLLVALALLRRLAPLERAWTGAVVGAAAGAMPGLLMQLACMYVPSHILAFHIGPVAALAAAGAALGPLLLRRV